MVARAGDTVSRRFVRLAFAAFSAGAALAPQVALACPFCAGRAKSGIATNVILGLFVSLPFLISWLIYRFIRNNAETTVAPLLPSRPSPAAYNRSRRTVQ